jgi:mono/diheme cytochrome c family protein
VDGAVSIRVIYRSSKGDIMKYVGLGTAVVGLALFGVGAVGFAAEKADFGKQEYDANCAVCHGLAGKGDGSYGELLKTRATDLTVLAKKNGGVYPFARVYEAIDGTLPVKAHGTTEMPIWGTVYKAKAAEMALEYPELFARARILALDEYIYRLQAK